MEPVNRDPIVHDIYEPSTGTWQYVVADPSSKHCIIINAIHEVGTGVNTRAPDGILDLVKRQKYRVDYLLETRPTTSHRTAVYYLRMQLLEFQGFAPRTCGGSNISSMKTLFQRKHGKQKQLTTDYDAHFQDGDSFWVGQMEVTVVQLDGLTQEHLGFVVNEYLFGLHWFTQLRGLETSLDDSDISTLRLRNLWLSMAKLMAFPVQYRIYFDNTSGPTNGGEPYTTILDASEFNQFSCMGEDSFVYHWKAKLTLRCTLDRPKSRRRLPSPPQGPITSGGS